MRLIKMFLLLFITTATIAHISHNASREQLQKIFLRYLHSQKAFFDVHIHRTLAAVVNSMAKEFNRQCGCLSRTYLYELISLLFMRAAIASAQPRRNYINNRTTINNLLLHWSDPPKRDASQWQPKIAAAGKQIELATRDNLRLDAMLDYIRGSHGGLFISEFTGP